MNLLNYTSILSLLIFLGSCVGTEKTVLTFEEKVQNSFNEELSIDIYKETVYPIIKQNCSACHGDSGIQQPKFASDNIDKSYNSLFDNNLVDLDDPIGSRIVERPLMENHNGCGTKCVDLGKRMLAAVEEWASRINASSDGGQNIPIEELAIFGGDTINSTGITDVQGSCINGIQIQGNIADTNKFTLVCINAKFSFQVVLPVNQDQLLVKVSQKLASGEIQQDQVLIKRAAEVIPPSDGASSPWEKAKYVVDNFCISCHSSGGSASNLVINTSSADSLANSIFVKEGDADNSALFRSLLYSGFKQSMPLVQQGQDGKLYAENYTLWVKEWINSRTRAPAGTPAVADDAPAWDKAKYVVENFCVSCHSNGGSVSEIVFDTSSEDALANSNFISEGNASESGFYKTLQFAGEDESMPAIDLGIDGELYIEKYTIWINEWINSRAPPSTGGGGTTPPPPPPPPGPSLPPIDELTATSWEKTQYVVNNFCISCHSSGGSASHAILDTTSESALLSSKYVTGGDALNSSLFKRLIFSGSDPLVATMPLTQKNLYVEKFTLWVRDWINANAPAPPPLEPLPPAVANPAPDTAMKLLSIRELNNTLKDLFGVNDYANAFFPKDIFNPFDTTSSKVANQLFVEALSNMAYALSGSLVTQQSFRNNFLKCTPSGSGDTNCLSNVTRTLGQRVFRRPLTNQEVSAIVTSAVSYAVEDNNFNTGMQYIVLTLLQSPHFIYKVELGTGTNNLRSLNNYEIVTRLSYLLLSTGPSQALLNRANGSAITSAELKTLAADMLQNNQFARDNLKLFHKQWLRYADPFIPENLKPLMIQETDALVELILDDSSKKWTDLFTYNQTYVNQQLAQHYGIPGVSGSSPRWVTYQNPMRSGILSHGTFLSYLARGNFDTSPTKRGKYIAENLLCRTILPPPPNVNVDALPDMDPNATAECKVEQYKEHAQKGSGCYNCHQAMDPIGFGLENLDGLGRYRTVEVDNPNCTISGDGEVAYLGAFKGPKQLGAMVASSDELTNCAVEKFFEFTMGREPASMDKPQVDIVHRKFQTSGENFNDLVIEFVGHPNFIYRREE